MNGTAITRAGRIALALALCVAFSPHTARGGSRGEDALFVPVSPKRVAALPESVRRQPETVIRQRHVTVNFAYFKSRVLAAGRAGREPQKVAVNLFEDVKLMLDPTNVRRNADGVYLWESDIEAKFWGRAMIALNKKTAMGTIEIDDKVYEINTVYQNIVSISEIDHRKFEDEAPPVTPLRRPASSASGQAGAKSATLPRPEGDATARTVTLSVLLVLPLPHYQQICLYPPAQTTYKASITQNLDGVFNYFPTGVRSVVNVACIYYAPRGGGLDADLEWVSTNSTVAAYRNQLGADLVSLQVPDADEICGIGNYNPPPVTSEDVDSVYSVVKWSCARSNYTLAHEIGHNMGMHHDRSAEEAQQSPDCNFGYISPTSEFRTVMSYGDSCGNCRRVGTYSTPQFKSTEAGRFGVPCDAPPNSSGDYRRANNLEQFVTAAQVVSGFR